MNAVTRDLCDDLTTKPGTKIFQALYRVIGVSVNA
jgi:hypothetical protein